MIEKVAKSNPRPLITLLLLLLFVAILARNSWLNDDAYISFRTVDNFVNGYGLTWNTDERVQAYTHPLWLFVLSAAYSLTHEIYYTSQWLSIFIATATLAFVMWRIAPDWATAVLILLLLTFSKAFVDFSTSGLENPLSHLLLALFFYLYFHPSPPTRQRLFWLIFLANLGLLTRLDLLFLYLPPLLWAIWQARQQRPLLPILLGCLPMLSWELFSLIYYGFPFPNTAYAKALATGIPASALAKQGLLYLQNSLKWDPLTLLTIAAAFITLIIRVARSSFSATVLPALATALGLLAYLLYIVKIGGDFMSGRFLTAPLLTAVILLTQAKLPINKWSGATAVLLILSLGLLGKEPPPLSGPDFGRRPHDTDNIRDGHIADERLYYYPYTGLLNPERQLHPWHEQGQFIHENGPLVLEHGNIGFLGFHAGPQVHIIDRNALADPLLARLPIQDPQNWRIGHFRRQVPAGYTESFFTGQNLIQPPELALYYDKLALLIRGDIWAKERWQEIWKFNTGHYAPQTWHPPPSGDP